jgi:hypothetical protein
MRFPWSVAIAIAVVIVAYYAALAWRVIGA